MKRFVTINFYNSEEINLWKDNGGIPFSLSKYLRYKSTYVYTGNKNDITNEIYQKYADIDFPEETPEEKEAAWERLCVRIKEKYGEDAI